MIYFSKGYRSVSTSNILVEVCSNDACLPCTYCSSCTPVPWEVTRKGSTSCSRYYSSSITAASGLRVAEVAAWHDTRGSSRSIWPFPYGDVACLAVSSADADLRPAATAPDETDDPWWCPALFCLGCWLLRGPCSDWKLKSIANGTKSKCRPCSVPGFGVPSWNSAH
jgi:hypothetical protein